MTTTFFSRRYNSQKVLIFSLVVLAVNGVIITIAHFKGLGFPYDTFLVNPVDRFGDFFMVIDGLGIVDTWGGENPNFIYYQHAFPVPMSLYFVSAKLIQLSESPKLIFWLAILAALTIAAFSARRNDTPWLSIVKAVATYPVIFAVDRGNLAILVFALILLALSTEQLAVATLAIAIATSIKFTPFVFLIPIITRGSFSFTKARNTILLFLGWLVILNAGAILVNGYFLPPHEYSPSILFSELIKAYEANHILKNEGLSYGSSLYMATVYIAGAMQVLIPFKAHEWILVLYGIVVFILILKKDVIRQTQRMLLSENMTFVACISVVLFMPVTADYYLTILLVPLLLFPNASFSLGYLILFGLVLGAKNYPYFDFINGYIPLSYQPFLNPLLLIILLFAEFNLVPGVNRSEGASQPVLPAFVEWLNKMNIRYIDPYRKKITIAFAAIIVVAVVGVRVHLSKKEAHNVETGLPKDFDPQTYLELHPVLQEFWHSVGIYESGQALWDRAEVHYRDFGSRDNWVYRSTLQRILYPRF